MKAKRSYRSLMTPIVLGSLAVTLTIFLLVGWIVVTWRTITVTREVVANTWLLVIGLISFAVVLSVIIIVSFFLAREILEVRRQTTFIDSVTHELKSPLASLKLCLETIARPEVAPADRERLRQMMLGDVERLSTFIDDILEASRLAHGRRSLTLSNVDLGELVRQSVVGVERRYKLEPGTIRVAVPEGVRLYTDATALETVLKNLLDNGVKYSDAPVTVSVTVERDGTGYAIEVADRGIGIPSKHLKRIFERFYRVPSEAVHARRGTGLGLFVVSSLVRNLGGRLTAYSEGPRRGTRVRIELPQQPALREA